MLTLDDIKDFKVENRKIILPKQEGNIGNLIFLFYTTPKKCINAVNNSSSLLNRQNYWKYIYRDYKYNFKLFNKNIRYTNLKERDEIINTYSNSMIGVKGIKNFSIIKNKNCFIDLSEYAFQFFNFKKKSWKITLKEFFNLLSLSINDNKFINSNKKILLLDINEYNAEKHDIIRYQLLSNPFNILYLALKKDLNSVKSLGNLEIIIVDNEKSKFFKFNTNNLTKLSSTDFKNAITKMNPRIISEELDNDNHLDVYGDISSDAPQDMLNKAKNLNILRASLNEDEEDTVKKSLTDKIVDLSKKKNNHLNNDDSELSNNNEYEEDSEEEEEEEEKNPTDSNKKSNEDESNDEEYENELNDELNNLSEDEEEAIGQVQELISKKIPDTVVSARDAKLKEAQKQIKLESGQTLSELLDNVKNNPSLKSIPLTNVEDKVETLNSHITKMTFPNFEKSYNEQVFEHDFYSVFNSLSEKKDLPVYIKKVVKTDTSDSLNLKDTYKFELQDSLYGRTHTLTVDVPKFIEGKYMYLGGNKKIFIKQLILKPIVKIAPDTVQICSSYSKIFMYRYGDSSSPLLQNLIKIISTDEKHFKVKKGNSTPFNKNYKTSIEYDLMAKNFLEVKIKGTDITLIFSQEAINEFAEKHNLQKQLMDIDRDKNLIIGYIERNNAYTFINIKTDEAVTAAVGFNNGEDIDPNEEEHNIDNESLSDFIISMIEAYVKDFDINNEIKTVGGKIGKRYIYSRCKIMKKFVPTILLLSYCEGLSTVLRKAKINFIFQQERPKFINNKEKLEKGVIQFSNGYLIFDRYPIQNSLLLNAFTLIDTKAYTYEDMDNIGTYIDIFGNLYNSRILASAFDSFYDNMIDPITKEILIDMNYPYEFVELLLVANVLLCDNNYSSEINMNNFRVRSNEMVNAMLYKIIANAFSKYKRTAKNKTPIKISIPPTALLKEIVTSQSVEDYSILNPIVETEKDRTITAKGPSGINLAQSYTEEKRSYDDTMVGLMAMSTSPDGNCGISRTLTVEPKIVSPRGFIDTTKTNKDFGDANLFSMGEMLTPLGVTRDDSIRTAMAIKQSKHIIPVKKMDPVLMSNGAEKVLPYHLSTDFSVVAKHDGVVEKVDEKNNLMVVKYIWKEKGVQKVDHQVINFDSQIAKNGGGGFFLENKLKPYVKLGDKFKAKDVIAANDKFFDTYKDGVKYNIGTLCKVACMSNYNTFEDSTVVTTRLSQKMASDITMEKHLILGANANILKIVKPGDKINVNDVLIEYDQANDDDAINKLLTNVSNDLKEEVSNLSRGKIISKYTGYIADVKIYSVSELEELSPSLQEVVKSYWKRISDKKKILKQYNITDPSKTGNLYMYEDKPIKPTNGKVKGFTINEGVLIFIYITYHNPFSIGDKLTNFSALKGVCTEILPLGDEFYSEFRPKEEISAYFPPGGMLARMVPSALITMFGNKVIIELKRKLGEIYLGEYHYENDFDGHIDGVPDKVIK